MKVFALALVVLPAAFAVVQGQTPPSAIAPPAEPAAVAEGPLLAPPPSAVDWWGEEQALPHGRIWAEADFQLWWLRGAFLPPLVTSSPAGTPINQAGVLGANGTTVLFGDSRVNNDSRAGFRLAVGGWFNDTQTLGVEADFLYLPGRTTSFSAQSAGNPILARPFTDALSGGQSAERIAFPGDLTGSVLADAGTSGLVGVGVLFRENLCCSDCWRLDTLVGYRSLNFSDSLNVTESLTNANPNSPQFIPLGANLLVADRFSAKNDLQAVDLGFTGEYRQGPLSLAVRGRVAMGYDEQSVAIGGKTIISAAPAPQAVDLGGLLAQASNIGRTSRREFSMVPQVDVKLGWQINQNLTASLGYSYLYWSDVVRAADLIDRNVNPNLIPPAVSPSSGPNRPVFVFQRNVLSGQGLNLQLEYGF